MEPAASGLLDLADLIDLAEFEDPTSPLITYLSSSGDVGCNKRSLKLKLVLLVVIELITTSSFYGLVRLRRLKLLR